MTDLNASPRHPLSGKEIFEKCHRSVVRVYALNRQGAEVGQGSGFVVEGHRVVTNAHVVDQAASIRVVDSFNRTLAGPTVVATDAPNDLAVVQLSVVDTPPLQLADADDLTPGQTVFAIGAPLGLPNTISEGLLSAIRRDDTNRTPLLQITAAISPGSSGGPVLSDTGMVIGIATAYLRSGQNLNFAVPSDAAQTLLDSIAATSLPPNPQTDWATPDAWLVCAVDDAINAGDARKMAILSQQLALANRLEPEAAPLARAARICVGDIDLQYSDSVVHVLAALHLTNQADLANNLAPKQAYSQR